MTTERAQRRLAAILATDVVGYSRLMERDEVGTLAALNELRQTVLNPLLAKHQGRIVKLIGDGMLAEFASAVNAVDCAVELQRAIHSVNAGQPDDRCIVLRVGINLGDVLVEGRDLYGDGVNIAARLQALADPGSVFVSQAVFSHVRGKVQFGFDDLGEQTLKNMAEPVRVYRVASLTTARAIADSKAVQSWRPSIAVLPFTNLSGDPEQQYFSDGITEDIITELARYHSLWVIARNSCFQFRGPSVDIPAVRHALGVRYVVEGSCRKVGPRVRVTAQLIDAVSQSHLWAEKYDRDMNDIFAVQDEVTHAVAATLEGRVAASAVEHARRKPTKDWVAYDYFLQGRDCVNRYQMSDGEPFFARAVELDPTYVHAHAWRAIALAGMYLFDNQPELIEQAWASARTALALDENDASSHHAMGYVALRSGQLDLAGLHFDRAISLNPNDVNIACDRANWLMYVGRLEEALRSVDLAMHRDPFAPTWVWEVRGLILYHMKRYDEAIAAYLTMSTRTLWTPACLAAAYAQVGQLDNARRELDSTLKSTPNAASLIAEGFRDVYANASLSEHWLEGLRKAGLTVR
jgi:adenylate cyclase